MKKIILIILAILTIIFMYQKVGASEIVIPDSAIRLRVIPNSNSLLDQEMKLKVKDYLESDVINIFNGVDSIDEARMVIENKIPEINERINNIFIENDYDMNFNVKYGYNYFPDKEYNGITYSEGYYESLVVEIGEAKGDNWWCVLFPTLCMLDTEDKDNVEYKIGVIELLSEIF